MSITAEHSAAMQAGRERALARAAAVQEQITARYSTWVKEDARLWAAFINLDGADRETGRHAWKAHFATIPVIP